MKRLTVAGGSVAGMLAALVLAPAAGAVTPAVAANDCVFTPSGSTTVALQADCSTDHTLFIPTGKTLDGQNHKITAMDPVGGSFLGAVLKNQGASAGVRNITVTASGLSVVCHGGNDRLRGILFEGTGGLIINATVTGVRQGQSGCQEGNAIEVRNFSPAGARAAHRLGVAVINSTVSDYQKNGITINGLYNVTVSHNTVLGDGPANYIAQNGIQIGYGASGTVNNNYVSGNYYTGAATGTTSAGILGYGERSGADNELTGNVTFSKNVLADNQVGFDIENYDLTGDPNNPTYTVTSLKVPNTVSDNWIWADRHVGVGVAGAYDRSNGDSYLNNRISGYTTGFDTTGAKHLTLTGNQVRF